MSDTNPNEISTTVPADAIYQVADPTPATDEPMIDVYDTNGVRGKIPQSQAGDAFKNQFKFASQDAMGNWKPEQPVAVSMKDASGKFSQGGYAPVSKAGQGLKDGALQIGPPSQAKFNNTEGSGIGTAGIDPFLFSAAPKIADAVKATGKVLKIGGKALLKTAMNPTPSGFASAIADEAAEEQQDGGIPNSKAIVSAPLKEFTGVRQPGESATLGFTGNDPSQQGIATQTANAMSTIMGGDPAGARSHFDKAAFLTSNGNPTEASAENQRGTADLLAVPLATAGLGRLTGTGAVGKVASGVQDAASDAAQLARLRTLPASSLTPAELLTRTLNKNSVFKGGSAQNLLDLHDVASSALPRIADAANSLGSDISGANDMLAAIKQAKQNLLAEHQSVLGPDETLSEIGPNQRQALSDDMNALNLVQQRIEDLQAVENAKAASKGKVPTSKGEAINKIAQGAGKYAATRAIGSALPLGGPVTRAALNAAGVTSAFSDLSSGIKGLTSKGAGLAPSALDSALTTIFAHPDLDQLFERPTGAGNLSTPPPSSIPEALRPYLGDLSVQHETNIAPPRQPHGEAIVTPDAEDVPMEPTRPPYAPYAGDLSVQHESNITPPRTLHGNAYLEPDAEYTDMEPTREPYQPFDGDRSVPHSSVIAPPETPHGNARMAPDTPDPRFNLGGSSTTDIPLPIRKAMASTPATTPAPTAAASSIPDIIAKAMAAGKAEDLGGLGQVETGANPSTPVGSRPVTRNVVRPPQAPFDANNLAPDAAFKFSRSAAQSGTDAATEWLSSQTLGRLKSMASGRGIPFDGSLDQATLRSQLIGSIADDLSDGELQNFGDQAIERSRFSPRQGKAKPAPAPLTGEDLIAALQQMSASKTPPDAVPSVIQDLISGTSTAPISDKIGGAKVLAGDVPLTGPVSPLAAEITRLTAELKLAKTPAEIADTQQAIDYAQAQLEKRPYSPGPDQATVENLPATQPRDVDPGTYNRETKVHTPGKNKPTTRRNQ